MVESNLDFKDLILCLWRKKFLIIIITIIFAIFGILKASNTASILSKSFEDTYVSQTKIIIGNTEKKIISIQDNNENKSDNQDRIETIATSVSEEKAQTFEQILKTNEILNSVIKELNLNLKTSELKRAISLEKDLKSYILILTVKHNNEKQAIEIAKLLIEKLEKKLNEVYRIENISVIDTPRILTSNEVDSLFLANKPSLLKQGIKYSAVGFILVCGVIVILEIFNNSVTDEKQLENITKLKNLAKLRNERYNDDDRFKLLRVNINGCKTILVTSSENKDGKTYVATNLAKAFSKQEKKVVLIDLVKNENDLIKKSTGKGLTDYLKSDDKFVEKYVLDTHIKNLGILPLGKETDTVTELLEGPKMQEAINTLERLYDIIIIDSKNVLESADTLAVAKISKYSVLVVAQRKTKLENIIKAKNNIEDIGGNVVGTVLTNVKR